MEQHKKWHILCFILFSFFIGLFYYFYNNFSLDNNILFLSNKLFLGNWLRKGIFPFFNPYIYAGTPFAFDIGLGNFHPMNLLFLFPFPLSYSLWVALGCFVFMVGFYLFFSQYASLSYSFLLTLILFFSGSGLIRLNNPTVFLPITHLGLFMYSLRFLQEKKIIKKAFPYLMGILLLISGHLQVSLYCFIFGLFISIFLYGISFKKVFLYGFICFLSLSWYFALSLPIILESTRTVAGSDYNRMGSLLFPQLIQFVLPTFFGAVFNGSSWFVGSSYFMVSSFYFTFGLLCLFFQKKINNWLFYLTIFLWIFSLGIVSIPFLRGASQIIVFIHIVYLILFAKNESVLKKNYLTIPFPFFIISLFLFFGASLFFVSPLFSEIFLSLYLKIKHVPSLYYDAETIHQIGSLFSLSLIPIILFSFFGILKKRYPVNTILFVLCEGIFVLFVHNYYVPNTVFLQNTKYELDTINYRVQTAADVVPFFGYRAYNANILLKPPFSKEIPLVDKQEEKTREKLREIISYIPETWSMVAGFKSIQGFGTFLPFKLYKNFQEPSRDYKEVYANIIARNNLFGQTQEKVSINELETATITLYDKRWEDLGVRYFLSPSPLHYYDFLRKIGNIYIYENKKTLPLYRLVNKKSSEGISPIYEDPNKIIFNISNNDIGKTFEASINPGGFSISINGRKLPVQKENFLLRTKIQSSGVLKVEYSPIEHLKEDLKLL